MPAEPTSLAVRIPVHRGGVAVAYALVDPTDAHLADRRWRAHPKGYVQGDGSTLLHREVLGLIKGDGIEVDHINRDKLDCRRSNLRILTHAQNRQNNDPSGNQTWRGGGTSSRHRGVSWDKRRGKWKASVTVGGRFDLRKWSFQRDGRRAHAQPRPLRNGGRGERSRYRLSRRTYAVRGIAQPALLGSGSTRPLEVHMPDTPRTATGDLLIQAAAAGVAPLLLTCSPWAIHQDALPQLAAAMRLQADALTSMRAAAPQPTPQTGTVAVIPLQGIITPQGSFFDFLFGGAPGGLMGFREAFRAAMASPDVSAVVIDVDSPGGLIDLVPETAAEVRAARGQGKPIVAVADTQMASAAYWIASQADEIVATPSGSAGSIGIYRVHEDWSVANSNAGVAVSYVSAGKYKVEGNPNQPLDQAAREQWQADVQDIYNLFVADVALGRGVSAQEVIDGYGEGRALNATRALEAGIVDRIASYEDVLSGLTGAAPTAAGVTAQTSIVINALHPGDADALAAIASASVAALDAEDADGTPPADEPPPEPAALTDEEREMVAALLLA